MGGGTKKKIKKQDTASTYKQKYSTTTTSCVLQSEYKSATQEQLKKILLKKAKAEALDKLYGSLIKTNLQLENGKITKDEVQQLSIGNVRLQGKAKYFNGNNWGEVCVTVNAYITRKDLLKYQPKNVILKNFCYNNPNANIHNIQENANLQAYKAALIQYKPSLKYLSKREIEDLIHGFSKTNEHFNLQTGVYCFDSVITLLPYELELIKKKKKKKKKTIKRKKHRPAQHKKIKPSLQKKSYTHGLKVTFYDKQDVEFQKPLYSTVLQRSLWLKGKGFLNDKLKQNIIYQIKMEGYIKFDKDVTALKLLADVYKAVIKIDGKTVLTDRDTYTKIHLKGGKIHKLSIYLKTTNSYDIALLAKKVGESSFVTVGLQNLYR